MEKTAKVQKVVVNETPIRTSNNFEINNITVDYNCDQLCQTHLIAKREKCDKIDQNKIVAKNRLKYGLGDVLENQVIQDANKNFKIELDENNKDVNVFNFKVSELIDNIEIIAKENSNAKIIIKYYSHEKSYHNGICKIKLENNAKLHLTIINMIDKTSDNFYSIESTLMENSEFNCTIVEFGGKNSISNYYSNIEGKQAVNNLKTIYLGDEQQVFDINYIAELCGQKSSVDIEVQGALKDNTKKNFKGTIDFKQGCKGAKGSESENCILLSDTAKSKALPMLLCHEDDVEGSHSTSAGKIDTQELFYLMTRGIDEKYAKKLLVRAKFEHIIEQIEDESTRKEILNEMDKKLD